MTSDSVGKAKALELYGHGRTNLFAISSVSVRHFRPYPSHLLPVTFPLAPRVLMKQAGHSNEAKQTTDRR